MHQSGLHFGAVQFDGPGTDLPRTNSKLNAEYVDLHNNTGQAVQMRGYTVKTTAGALYTFPAFTLAAWKTVRLKNGQGSNTAATVFRKRDTFWFNNSSGSLTLTAPGGAKKDTCAWKANGRGYTTCH
ncbi:lamin tail domain-containing protein [Streptomyces sp. NBC_01244]|uniref:lamin tail domain-containing protein n=1 Tax=Streptomyces sp. NBC_01244 TaxID=2903797 RepID=UPI002E0F9AEF|nr:lamin tail domain-containing protein [Streptomyces sp. NBC_01244]